MATTYDKASLVMLPSGYKDDKLYSIKPTDGSGDFTFSRDGAGASPATRVNASGLIEKGRENLATYSNDFSNASYVKVNASLSKNATDYLGVANNAWTFSKSAANGQFYKQVTLSEVNTFSIYAKSGSLNWMRLVVDGGGAEAFFDLQNGAIGTTSFNNIDATIEPVGSGWYRCSVTCTSVTYVNAYPADSDGVISGTSGSILISFNQVESGLVATDYIETTTAPVSAGLLGDMPRLDYSGGATCPSLLLEPSRVNLIEHSEHIGGYLKERVVITANSITSPEGVQNAAKIDADSSPNNTHNAYLGPYTNTAGNVTYSGFFKKGEYDWVHFGGGAANSKTWFNLNTGVVGSQSSDVVTASMIDFGNGWYRCIVVVNYASTSNYVEFGPASIDNSRVISGTPIGGIYCWGIQIEDSASYPTSYIPTYGSASTRGLDVCIDAGNSSTFNDAEGTLFINVEHIEGFVSVSDGTGNNRISIGSELNDPRILFLTQSGGAIQTYIPSNNWSIGSSDKVLISYKLNEVKMYINGALVSTDTSYALATGLDVCLFTSGGVTGHLNGDLKQVLYFPTALTESEAIALTTI